MLAVDFCFWGKFSAHTSMCRRRGGGVATFKYNVCIDFNYTIREKRHKLLSFLQLNSSICDNFFEIYY